MQHGGGVLCLTARPWAELSAIKLPARAPEAPVQAQPPAVDPRDGTNLLCLLSSALHADASVATEAGARVPGHRVMLASREGVSENDDGSYQIARAGGELPAVALARLYGEGSGARAARAHLLGALASARFADVVVDVAGEAIPAHRAILAARHSWFRAAFAWADRADGAGAVARVALPHDELGGADGAAARPLLAYLYTGHRAERDALVARHAARGTLVELAYCLDALLCADAARAALARAADALDDANAPALLRVARELGCEPLARAAASHIVRDVASVAAACPHFDALVPPPLRRALDALAAAARSNPLCCGAALADAREFVGLALSGPSGMKLRPPFPLRFVGMLREALDEQTVRLAEASARQAAERRRDDGADRGRAARLDAVDAALRARAVQIEHLRDVAEAHETKLARADGGGAARGPAAVTPGGELVPSYAWRAVPDGASVPAGLEVRLRLVGDDDGVGALSPGGGADRLARIPPVWRLALWLDAPARRYHRRDVTATTLVGEVVDAIADELRDDPARIALCVGGPGPDAEVLEPWRSFDAQLFGQRTLLRVVRAEAPTEMEM